MTSKVIFATVLYLGAFALPVDRAAHAQAASTRGGTTAEMDRLRADLEKANSDIQILKRSRRGVRDDYRLRQRMADAETLARRLTQAEAALRRERGDGSPATGAALFAASPAAGPGDGPVELVAKADLLDDQARRLASEAESLAQVAGQMRGRQSLRRRAGLLERDPFIGLDASRRNMALTTRPRLSPSSGELGGAAPAFGAPVADTSATRTASPSGAAPPSAAAPPAAPMGAPGSAATSVPSPAPAAPAARVESQPQTVTSQLRTFLDPQTLAEIKTIESSGKPLADVEALEKAAAALRVRAAALQAQSRQLRWRARP